MWLGWDYLAEMGLIIVARGGQRAQRAQGAQGAEEAEGADARGRTATGAWDSTGLGSTSTSSFPWSMVHQQDV